jgi:hypothetical protein
MTGRRMLLRDFFADDSFPQRFPGWIAEATRLTRRDRPVVIIMDVALNGTDASRFDRWAAAYVEAVAALAVRRVPLPGGTAYILPPAGPAAG